MSEEDKYVEIELEFPQETWDKIDRIAKQKGVDRITLINDIVEKKLEESKEDG